MNDPHNLDRFVAAQERVFDRVVGELGSGRKQSHWMWFVFPQIRGLGRSPMAQMYAIASLDEAKAYLQHPILGARLRECVRLVNGVEGRNSTEILGSPDDMKFHSSMTLFALADPEEPLFADALRKYCGGDYDRATMERLGR
jgi:uncharacterized protein (DUF1810 family)